MNQVKEIPVDHLASIPAKAVDTAEPPTWTGWRQIGSVIFHPPYLKKTLRIALIVGTVLFAVNHLDEVLHGQATMKVWLKGALTYIVPFCVSNFGVLVAARRAP